MISVLSLYPLGRIPHGNNIGSNVGHVKVEAALHQSLLLQANALPQKIARAKAAPQCEFLLVLIIILIVQIFVIPIYSGGDGHDFPLDVQELEDFQRLLLVKVDFPLLLWLLSFLKQPKPIQVRLDLQSLL